ncbi:MAG: UDP-N-acetylmuramate:L-alanyl-gamma-D-glutamyl-meso-diaminopimelate ligase [Chthoniobacterales bacterium]|nr:UDP-N-acetylmuramate:L-alanyl-gamma-D-glutamyl-meso-diaminopimelate ligase [Chthoniobacterales bacterium]
MFDKIQTFHFLGIAGTAMGAVAGALQELGYTVSGTDEAIYPPISEFLAERKIPVALGYTAENVPERADLFIIGNAISRGNPALECILNRKVPYLSLPETLRLFFLSGRHNLVVTGTHGKTTTSSLLAWIFEHAGLNPSFLIGGIPNNFNQGCRILPFSQSRYFILEGDEYDTAFFDKRPKFLHYLPELVIVNNIEFDHADIYTNIEEIKLAFRRLLQIVPSNGLVLLNADDSNCLEISPYSLAPILTIGTSQNSAEQIRNIRLLRDKSVFQILHTEFEIPLCGAFNVRNAAMAIVAAHNYGIPLADIQNALRNFRGVKRRQEIRAIIHNITIVDDFAHHPTAIYETLSTLHSQYPQARIWALFEPRSNTTRRNVFQNTLPSSFEPASGIFVAAVNRPEKIPPAQRLDPQRLVDDLRARGKIAYYSENTRELAELVTEYSQPGDLIVTLSNGSFNGIHHYLLPLLQRKSHGAV